MTTTPEDVFHDRAEMMEAMASPEYAASGRYRENIAAKLQRSLALGTVASMGEQIAHDQRAHERIATTAVEGLYGADVPMPKTHAASAEGLTLGQGYFKTPEQVAAAFSAPAFEIDPTYRAAAQEKVARSMREGWLTADMQAADPTAPGR